MSAGLNLRWPIWIGVVAEDLETQRRFYRDTLGLTEVEAGEDWVWFDMDGRNVFELLARSEEPQYDRKRVSIGFAVEDIRAARDELIARGVEPVTDVLGGPESHQYWCYFRDAEGNLFEIAQRLGAPAL
jgi:catechol 2,3-dioxygenase-like lactoylglutathione lyase family enzyme